ncbi:MAG: DUF1587 domain-containing protein [Nannocystaceae bacterium]|nr:DUF1587 domain-containing protein [Nannocystaceae bacterium]
MKVIGERRFRHLAPWTILLCSACYSGYPAAETSDGTESGSDDETAETDETGDTTTDDDSNGDCNAAAGFGPMRRLTKPQYDNTVADLFSGVVEPSQDFPTSVIHEEYSNNPAANIVSLSAAEDILIAAEHVGVQVVDQIEEIVDCTPLSLIHI